MAKFRKKPVVIEAVQWDPSKQSFDEICELLGNRNWLPGDMGSDTFYIETLEGKMKVSPGWWVIKGVEGEAYPCSDSIFKATYEEV